MTDLEETPQPTPKNFGDMPPRPPIATGRELLPGGPRAERWVVAAALSVGIGADVLASGRPAGLGTTIVLLGVLAWILGLHLLPGLRLPSRNRWFVAAALALLAVSYSLRDSPDLLALNGCVIAAGLVVLSARIERRRMREARPSELIIAAFELFAVTARRACFLISRTLRLPRRDPFVESGARHRHGRDVVIGLLVAVPIIAVFGALLASSDAGFERLLSDIFSIDVDLEAPFEHGFTIAWTGFAALVVLVAALASEPTSRIDERPASWAGPAVVWIVLGSTSALFALFLALQGSYLFGADGYLRERTGLTAAEYARGGFYQLLTASGLTVLLLLAARGSFAARSASALAYRWLAPVLAALSMVLAASAMARMFVYADRFGLTQQRIFAIAILLWITVVLGWMAVRIALDRMLALGAFASCAGLVVVLALNVANPEQLAARTNLERRGTAGDRTVDVEYLRTLGADATPTIVDGLDRLRPEDAERLREVLATREAALQDGGWRSHNRARAAALDAIREDADD